MRLTLSHIIKACLLSVSAMAVSSCSLIEDDLKDCPTGLYVRFIYDYNTLRADMFKDHVGHVELYVYDEAGRLAAKRTVSNSAAQSPLNEYGYTMHFTQEELPAGHSYTLKAVALQRDWNETLSNPGAKYRYSASPSDNSESMQVSLDHNTAPVEGTSQYEVSNAAPLDTFWHTLKVIPHIPQDGRGVPAMDKTIKPYSPYPASEQTVKVESGKATYATVSMIRDTKHLNLTLRHVDDPETVFASDYEVKIVDNNAHLTHDNTVLTHDSLRYTPYASWTSALREDNSLIVEEVNSGNPGQYHSGSRDGEEGSQVVQRTAHYNLMFNRLMINEDDNSDNALLEIHNRHTGDLVARVNLPYILSQGRMAYEIQNYGTQEYLDREHDYHLDFFLKGGEWYAIEIHVLSWTKRIQNFQL